MCIRDRITIAVPNDFHKEIAVAALNAGKNVISEKPVTLSSVDLTEMIEAARKMCIRDRPDCLRL